MTILHLKKAGVADFGVLEAGGLMDSVNRKINLADSGRKKERILTIAVLRAAETLNIDSKDLAKIIGVSSASISRYRAGTANISYESKEAECAAMFIRAYHSLDSILAGDAGNCRRWIEAEHKLLGGIPKVLMERIDGLNQVAEYLESMRG